MSYSQLPERASLEYLRKLAKDRLEALRQIDPKAKLAHALLSVARDHGFSSWRALKAEVDRRRADDAAQFFEACERGDDGSLPRLLRDRPDLVRLANPTSHYGGWTGLHTAARRGHLATVRLLLEYGADPNAREAGDHTYPLHWAAAAGHVEVVRALLDAGGDVHGFGDAHELDAIGWATYFRRPEDPPNDEVVGLLLERGARHHVFSAICVGDLELIQGVAERSPEALDRRMSRFEHGQTPLHFAINRKRYDILDLLIDLGADLEAEDSHHQTALGMAMLRGDQEAMRRLHAAGAKAPEPSHATNAATLEPVASSVNKGVPMVRVPNVAETLAWYTSVGFKELGRYEDDGVANFGMVSLGKAEVMLSIGGKAGEQPTSLWFYTDRIDELYRLLKSRQIETARAALAGESDGQPAIEFVEELYEPFYGGRQFGIRDPNGYELYFMQPG